MDINLKLKEAIRHLIRFTPYYRQSKRALAQEFSTNILQKTVLDAIQNVPFYKGYGQYIKETFSIEDFPIIRKTDILNQEKNLVSSKVSKRFLFKVETGGSTGVSLELFRSLKTIASNQAATDMAFSLIGKDLRIGILRGQRPENGNIYKQMNNKTFVLSSYSLSNETLDEYIKVIKDNHINCLHVYPSSLSIFARLIKNRYGIFDYPELKGILSSSEIFSKEDKALVKEVFPNAKIIDLYGHNELACQAISVDNGFYNFIPNFGFVEFIDTGEKINGNRIAEIVATSIMNTTMPFIRYATDDYVELDSNNNIISIIGRTSDFVINKKQELAPCIILTRDKSMENVLNFQYYQPAEGILIFRVVTNNKFSDADKKYLLEDLNNSFNGKMDCSVEIVNSIERTKMGKQKRLIQHLDMNKYK